MARGMIDGVVINSSCAAWLKNPNVGSSTKNAQGRRTARRPSGPAGPDARAGVEPRRVRHQHGRGKVDLLAGGGGLPGRDAPRLQVGPGRVAATAYEPRSGRTGFLGRNWEPVAI